MLTHAAIKLTQVNIYFISTISTFRLRSSNCLGQQRCRKWLLFEIYQY